MSAFLSSGAFPRDARTTMVAQAYQGDVGFQMYDATRGDRTVRVVEQLTVADATITSSVFVTDMTAFAAFLGGEDGRSHSTTGRPPGSV